MPVSRKRLSTGILGLCLTGMLLPVAAQFAISSGEAQLKDKTLTLKADLELNLSDKAEEALGKGIPLEITTAVRLLQQRRWWWNKHIASWALKHKVRFHALSGQYLVSGKQPDPDVTESFTSLQEALKFMGNIDEIDLPLIETQTASKHVYIVQLRTSLDIEALPAPLRPVAYTSPAWHLNSGWSTWIVQN